MEEAFSISHRALRNYGLVIKDEVYTLSMANTALYTHFPESYIGYCFLWLSVLKDLYRLPLLMVIDIPHVINDLFLLNGWLSVFHQDAIYGHVPLPKHL